MSKTLWAFMIVAAITIATAGGGRLLSEEAAPAKKPAAIADLGFLAGTWSGDMWGGVFTAYYSTAEGGKVLSHSKLVEDGKIAFHEFEVFEEKDGKAYLQPYPGGRPAVGLALAELDREGKKATFENATKDYPTRIVYHRAAEDRLVITLSDPHGKSDKVETFDLKRQP